MVTEGVDEVDPAAEFLAREQSALAQLEDDDVPPPLPLTIENSGDTIDVEPPIDDRRGESSSPISARLNGERVHREPIPEPETIRKWREDQQRMLTEKDEEEAKKRDELRAQGKKDLEEWYVRYKETMEKSRAANRNAEREWIAERDRETTGQDWEKIAKMCDFNPKAARNQKDTSRLRSIMLQLKQTNIE